MSSRTKRFLAPVTAFLSISVLLMFFQNCTVATEFGSAQSQPAGKGNGTGYEGSPKDFENVDEETVCADGSHVVHNIHSDGNGRYSLTRANCADLNPPRNLDAANLRLDEILHENRSVAVFQGRLFIERSAPELPSTNPWAYGPIQALCQGETSEVRLQVAIRLNYAPNAPAPHFARVVSGYKSPIETLLADLPPGFTGSNVCQASRFYRSGAIHGYFNGQVSSSMVFYANGQTTGGNPATSRLQIARAAATPVSEVLISTEFQQRLIIPGADDSEALGCYSHFSNVNSTLSQRPAVVGRCFFVDVPSPVVF